MQLKTKITPPHPYETDLKLFIILLLKIMDKKSYNWIEINPAIALLECTSKQMQHTKSRVVHTYTANNMDKIGKT